MFCFFIYDLFDEHTSTRILKSDLLAKGLRMYKNIFKLKKDFSCNFHFFFFLPVNKEEWWLRFKEELSTNSKENLDAYNEEMLNALEDCAHRLIIAEEALRCQTPVGPEVDHQTSNYVSIFIKLLFIEKNLKDSFHS